MDLHLGSAKDLMNLDHGSLTGHAQRSTPSPLANGGGAPGGGHKTTPQEDYDSQPAHKVPGPHLQLVPDGGEPTGKPVQMPDAVVTAQQLPAYSQNVAVTPGNTGVPAVGSRNDQGMTYGQVQAAGVNSPGYPRYGHAIDKQLAIANNAQNQFGTPDKVTETTTDHLTGQSLTQSGVAGSDYSSDELADQSGMSANHQSKLAQVTQGGPTPNLTPAKRGSGR